MKNNYLFLIIVILLLIYIYYQNKFGRKFYDCANVWDYTSNTNAQASFVNLSNNIANDSDTMAAIISDFGTEYQEYGICKYAAVEMVYSNKFTIEDYDMIIDCQCNKLR